jgi:Asp/Glu/hydantoin racemase
VSGRGILYIDPIGGDLYVERLTALARRAAPGGVEVTVRSLGGEVDATAYLPSYELLLNPLLSAVIKAEKDGFDGVVIGCSGDPGVEEAKVLVRIPVTGPFEAAAHTAAAFGRFAVLYLKTQVTAGEYHPDNGNWVRALCRRHGVSDRLAAVLPIEVAHPSVEETDKLMATDPPAFRDLVLSRMMEGLLNSGVRQVRHAYEEHEAEAVFCACTLWGGMLAPIAQQVPIPVLDAVATSVAYLGCLMTGASFSRSPV